MKIFSPFSISIQFILFISINAIGQTNDATEKEIRNALMMWNDAAKKSNLEDFMALYDNSSSIVLVGSDKGEIFTGKEQIKERLEGLFKNNSFQWEMNTIHIDHNENTAWVIVDGAMVVTSKEGEVFKTPYRFTGVLVRNKKDWKWRLFNGSIPQGE